jgi:hypothetical protein
LSGFFPFSLEQLVRFISFNKVSRSTTRTVSRKQQSKPLHLRIIDLRERDQSDDDSVKYLPVDPPEAFSPQAVWRSKEEFRFEEDEREEVNIFTWIQSTATNPALGDKKFNDATLVNHNLTYLSLNARNECLCVLRSF